VVAFISSALSSFGNRFILIIHTILVDKRGSPSNNQAHVSFRAAVLIAVGVAREQHIVLSVSGLSSRGFVFLCGLSFRTIRQPSPVI